MNYLHTTLKGCTKLLFSKPLLVDFRVRLFSVTVRTISLATIAAEGAANLGTHGPGGTLKTSDPGINRKSAYANGPCNKCHTAFPLVGRCRPSTSSQQNRSVVLKS
jgi:hypothetical protein